MMLLSTFGEGDPSGSRSATVKERSVRSLRCRHSLLLGALAFAGLSVVGATGLRAVDDPRFGFSTTGRGDFFIRGDSNQDGKVELSDAVFTLGYLFLGTEDPFCLDALDTTDDGTLDLSDAIATLGFLFLGQNVIPPPFPDAGVDPTPDTLNCDNGAFAHIRREIFATTCATSSCHSEQAGKGGMILEGMFAYSQLYQMPAANDAAIAEKFLRVHPGHPEDSFIFKKVSGELTVDEGVQMPQNGPPYLSSADIELIRHWIQAGAVPSTPADIILPKPSHGEQILIPPFDVLPGKEAQRNYFFKLKNEETIWVNQIEFLYPPGSHHLNFFTGDASDPVVAAVGQQPDGYFEDNFKVVPFADWSMRAASQRGRLNWRLPTGVAMPMEPHQQVLAQIHFVNVGSQVSPIGGCAAINLRTLSNVDPANPPTTLGTLFIQNTHIKIQPQSTAAFDFGVTFDHYGHNVPVKLAALTGHFHWRGKKFEIRLWDGLNKNPDGTPVTGDPVTHAGSEFDRMGPENTLYLSDNWDEPPFVLYGDDGPEIPVGYGLVYRTTYVNASDNLYCFGPHVETQEHSNAFIFFYPGPPEASGFLTFPPQCLGQGCTVPCTP